MKLTWFGGTTLRAYVGGEIVVVDAAGAPARVDRGEVLAGADHVLDSAASDAPPRRDPATWRPPAPKNLMDAPPPLEILRIASGTLLIAAAGEPPLVLLGAGEPPRFGRWADGAVIVLTSARAAPVAEASVLLDVARPRLIALAVDSERLDDIVAALAERLDGVGLVSLEPGLALEV